MLTRDTTVHVVGKRMQIYNIMHNGVGQLACNACTEQVNKPVWVAGLEQVFLLASPAPN